MDNSYAVRKILESYPKLTPQEISDRLAYSTFVSMPHRYLYCEVPKAACTTIKTLIHGIEGMPPIQYYLETWQTRRDMFVHARQNIKLPSLLDFDDRTQNLILNSPEFFRFAIVRNPYTRIISAWQSKVLLCEPGFEFVYKQILGSLPGLSNKRLVSFAEFLDFIESSDPGGFNPHWRLQTDHMFYNVLNFSVIGKLEQLGTILSRLQAHIGSSYPLQVPSGNRSPVAAGVTLTAEDASRIYRIYRQDFDNFGYEKSEIPPAKSSHTADSAGNVAAILDEIVERNILISLHIQEHDRLIARARRTPSHVFGAAVRRVRRWMNPSRSQLSHQASK